MCLLSSIVLVLEHGCWCGEHIVHNRVRYQAERPSALAICAGRPWPACVTDFFHNSHIFVHLAACTPQFIYLHVTIQPLVALFLLLICDQMGSNLFIDSQDDVLILKLRCI